MLKFKIIEILKSNTKMIEVIKDYNYKIKYSGRNYLK